MSSILKVSALMMVLVALPAAAPAAVIDWQNAVGGDFGTGSNWNGSVIPGSSDYAQFGPGGTYGVTLDASRTLLGLHLGTGLTKMVQLDLNGQTLATTSTTSATPSLLINADTGASEQYTLELSNGVMTTRRLSIGKDAGRSGTLVLTTGATITGGDNNQRVGESGTGVVMIQNGAVWNTGGHIRVGANATGNGTLNITGANSRLAITAAAHQIYIGGEGVGELNITNGGKIIQSHSGTKGGLLLIGRESAGATGLVNVSGLNSSISVQQLIVGRLGTGKLVVADQAAVTATNYMSMGVDSGDGTLEINGGTVTVGSLQDSDSLWASGSMYRIFLNEVSATPLTFLGTGKLTLTDSILDVQLGDDFDPVLGNVYNILKYGADMTGLFAGLAEGSQLTVDGYVFQLSYGDNPLSPTIWGGPGDVTLTLVEVPEPSAALLMFSGAAVVAAPRRKH